MTFKWTLDAKIQHWRRGYCGRSSFLQLVGNFREVVTSFILEKDEHVDMYEHVDMECA